MAVIWLPLLLSEIHLHSHTKAKQVTKVQILIVGEVTANVEVACRKFVI